MALRKPSPRDEIERLLSSPLSDEALRTELEVRAVEAAFRALTWLWGPRLYARSRVFWRPFILHRFSSVDLGSFSWALVRWKGEVGKTLEAWLDRVDADDDVQLFQRLYTWRLESEGGKSAERWRSDLVRRFEAAGDRAARLLVLAKFDLWQTLDEPSAVRLYRTDRLAKGFIAKHLPMSWGVFGEKRRRWQELSRLALEAGDEAFHFELYRRQVPVDEWRKDVLRLADEIPAPSELVDALRRRHPQLASWGAPLGDGLVELIERRGRDVFPYVMPNLRSAVSAWGGGGAYKKLLRLAEERGLLDLWSAVVRVGSTTGQFDDAVATLVASDLPGAEAASRLTALTGASRELHFGPISLAQVHPLSDRTAVALYARFPELVRGPFKPNVGARWGSDTPELARRAIAAEDDELVDFLAGRQAMREFGAKPATLALFADHYERLAGDPPRFCRRAAAALGQIPAFAIWRYDALVQQNRLARLLFERSRPHYLEDPVALRDLLEAPSIHVQALAFRVLGQDDERARRAAAANVDLLAAVLLRPLHRKTRLAAFPALLNAAHDETAARWLVARAREAFDLPDVRYPKAELVGLLGAILARWPTLRRDDERPRVYGEAA